MHWAYWSKKQKIGKAFMHVCVNSKNIMPNIRRERATETFRTSKIYNFEKFKSQQFEQQTNQKISNGRLVNTHDKTNGSTSGSPLKIEINSN